MGHRADRERGDSSGALPAARGTSPLFARIQPPRGRSGNSLKVIREIADPAVLAARPLAAGTQEIEQAWVRNPTLTARTRYGVQLVVGSTVSTDLWQHPAAVRYLLIPAVRWLRNSPSTASFNLDTPTQPVEKLIGDELGDKWRLGHAW